MDYFIVGAHSYKYCPMLQFQHSEVFSIIPTMLPSEEESLLNESVESEISENEEFRIETDNYGRRNSKVYDDNNFVVVKKNDNDIQLPLSSFVKNYCYPLTFESINRKDNNSKKSYSIAMYTRKEDGSQIAQFEFLSQIKFENLLPFELEVTILQNNKEYTSIIESGKIVDSLVARRGKITFVSVKNIKPYNSVLFCSGNNINLENIIDGLINDSKQKSRNFKLELTDEFGHKLCLNINIVSYLGDKIKHLYKIIFYVPYWIYDLTGLNLIPTENTEHPTIVSGFLNGYKGYTNSTPGGGDSGCVQTKNPETFPKMFNFHVKSQSRKIGMRALFGRQYCRRFSPNVLGAEGRLERLFGYMHDPTDNKNKYSKEKLKMYEFEVGMSVSLGKGVYRRLVRCIRLMPRIIIKNNLS